MNLNPQVGTQQQSDIAQNEFTQIYYAQRIDVNNQIIFKFRQKSQNINFDSPFKGMYECRLFVNQQQTIDNLQVQRYLIDEEREKIRIYKILCFVYQFKPQWIKHFGLYEIKKEKLLNGQIVDYKRSDKFILIHDIFPFTLQNLPPLRQKEKVLLALKIAQQIKKLHENNIIHTQIAPYTIGVNKGMDDVFLYGFGLTKGVSRLNVQQQSQKDERFIAPELLIQNNSQETVKSDIWSLGEVFNYLFNQHQHFSKLNPKLSDLIEQMKNKSENERPGLIRIERFLEDHYHEQPEEFTATNTSAFPNGSAFKSNNNNQIQQINNNNIQINIQTPRQIQYNNQQNPLVYQNTQRNNQFNNNQFQQQTLQQQPQNFSTFPQNRFQQQQNIIVFSQNRIVQNQQPILIQSNIRNQINPSPFQNFQPRLQ